MSLDTLKQDTRYIDNRREMTANNHVGDPALFARLERMAQLEDEALALAIEHGWDKDTESWTLTDN